MCSGCNESKSLSRCQGGRGGGHISPPISSLSSPLVPSRLTGSKEASKKKKKNLTEVKNKMASENILKGGEGREKQKEKGGDS